MGSQTNAKRFRSDSSKRIPFASGACGVRQPSPFAVTPQERWLSGWDGTAGVLTR